MIALEYNKVKISVPENWDDITVRAYETFCAAKPVTARERVSVVAGVCGMEADLLLSWPVEVFNKIVDYVDFLFGDNPAPPAPCIDVQGVRYVVSVEDKLTLGEWVDIDTVQKEGVNVLSNVLSIICRPAGEEYNADNNEKRAAMFAALPVSKVQGVLAFFLHCKNASDQRTEVYSKLTALYDRLPRTTLASLGRGDGTRSLPIWRATGYCILTALLRYRLRRFLHSSNTGKTRKRRMKRNVN